MNKVYVRSFMYEICCPPYHVFFPQAKKHQITFMSMFTCNFNTNAYLIVSLVACPMERILMNAHTTSLVNIDVESSLIDLMKHNTLDRENKRKTEES